MDYEDSYKSLKESLLHGGLTHRLKVDVRWVEAESITAAEAHQQLSNLDGILVPGGFGERGIAGMLEAIRYARENAIPYFGICLGMQTMVIEFVRNVCGIADAHSTEFEPAAKNRVFFKLRELKGVEDLGGTMRLGSWPCVLTPGSLAHHCYGKTRIDERHRHRYEFNREFDEPITSKGMVISGETPDKTYVEICELPGHLYLGCQFHRVQIKPLEPHPLFASFVAPPASAAPDGTPSGAAARRSSCGRARTAERPTALSQAPTAHGKRDGAWLGDRPVCEIEPLWKDRLVLGRALLVRRSDVRRLRRPALHRLPVPGSHIGDRERQHDPQPQEACHRR